MTTKLGDLAKALAAAAAVKSGQRVLDVGCGTGYFARLIAEVVGPDRLSVGLDASPEMIDYASRQVRRRTNCKFQLGAAESLSFPDQQFDVVVSMDGTPARLRSHGASGS